MSPYTINTINNRSIYLAGPIAKMPNGNRELFFEVAKDLRSKGKYAVIPFDIQPIHRNKDAMCPEGPLAGEGSNEHTAPCYMRGDIEWIAFKAAALVFLPGWENSSGARVEFTVAQACGIPIYFALRNDGEWIYTNSMGESLSDYQEPLREK